MLEITCFFVMRICIITSAFKGDDVKRCFKSELQALKDQYSLFEQNELLSGCVLLLIKSHFTVAVLSSRVTSVQILLAFFYFYWSVFVYSNSRSI